VSILVLDGQHENLTVTDPAVVNFINLDGERRHLVRRTPDGADLLLMASRGPAGPAGPSGPQGETGSQGPPGTVEDLPDLTLIFENALI
jgi:hypothetical protein